MTSRKRQNVLQALTEIPKRGSVVNTVFGQSTLPLRKRNRRRSATYDLVALCNLGSGCTSILTDRKAVGTFFLSQCGRCYSLVIQEGC